MDQINALVRRAPAWMIYILGAIPFAALVWSASVGGLGADPVKALENELGEWAAISDRLTGNYPLDAVGSALTEI